MPISEMVRQVRRTISKVDSFEAQMPTTRKRRLERSGGGHESWKEQDSSEKTLSSGYVKNKGSKGNSNTMESTDDIPGRPFSTRDLELHLYPYISEVWDMVASFGDLGRVCRSTFRCTCNCSPSKLPSGVSSGSAIRNKGKNPSSVDDGSISTSCECIVPIKLLHNHVKDYIQELVNLALMQLEEDNPKLFITVKVLAQLKPLEVKEYISWSEAKKASQTKQPIAAAEAGPNEESSGEFSEVDDLGIDGSEGGGWQPSQSSRFMARKEFFDSRTAVMSPNVYSAFVLQRNAFFIKKSSSNQGSKIEGGGDERVVKNSEFFRKWLELPKRARIRETALEVLAFLAYDRIGMAVEEALRKKSGGRLKEIPGGYCINKEEISQAIVALPSVLDHPGSFIGTPLKGFRQGLKYSGNPKCWAKSVTQGGKIKGEAQNFVDILQLSQQATLLLSSLD